MFARGYQRAVFSQATAAQFEIAPALPKTKIRVRGCFLSAAAAQDATFESATTSLGVAHLGVTQPFVLPPLDGNVGEEWLICAENEALNITLSAAAQTDGVIFWDRIDIKPNLDV